jgi:hypothetical protein
MEEKSITFILDILLRDKDSCTLPELYAAARKYMEEEKGRVYIDISDDEVNYYLYNYLDDYYYNDKINTVYKQQEVFCKICNTRHRKYPNIEKFNSIVGSNKKTYTEDDIRNAFMAGLNRGVYVASVVTKNPIDGDYPCYEEYIQKLKAEKS